MDLLLACEWMNVNSVLMHNNIFLPSNIIKHPLNVLTIERKISQFYQTEFG